MGVWTCGRAGMQMGVQKRMTVKKERRKERKKRKEKGKTHWFSEWADGRVDVLRMGVHECACGRT